MNKFQKELESIANMSQEEFEKEIGNYPNGETVDDFLNIGSDQYTKLITSMVENNLLEEAVHLLVEAKERLKIIDKCNNLPNIDSDYANITIYKIDKFLGEGL